MYLGEKEIDKIEGNVVTFKDGETTDKYNSIQLGYMVTEEPKDEGQLEYIILENVGKAVLDVLQEHNIRKGELSKVLEVVVSSFNQNFLIAVGKAFGTYQDDKAPIECQENIRMADIVQMKDK